jgi:DNA-directed RNA polymerase alpha subunit
MNPFVELKSKKSDSIEYDTIEFTLSGVNVSLANALRRTLLSDIPLVVFKTTPYQENKANIIANTSRLNNEIIKQRLSCIPIHINDVYNFPLKNYLLEVNVENNSDNILYVTTQDFMIKDIVNNKYLDETKTREIFPPNELGYFIDFVRLRPKLSDELLGEKIHLTCEFSIGTAKDDGTFNAVSTCAYGYTPDEDKIAINLTKKIQTWKDEGKNQKEIDYESKNWKSLDALRITKKDSFDFIIQTVGVYSNYELLDLACDIIIKRLNEVDNFIETDKLMINKSHNTLKNSYDIILEDDDYTIGKIIEYALYTKFYEGAKILTFCGYKKMHPHDSESIIRIAYDTEEPETFVKQNLKECIKDLIAVYQKIKKEFLKFVKN